MKDDWTSVETNMNKSKRKPKVTKILKKIFLYTTIAVGVALLLVVAYQIFEVLFTLAILVIAWIFPKRWR